MSKGNTPVKLPRFYKLLFLEIVVVGAIGAYVFIDSHDVYRWWVGDTHFTVAPSECNLHVNACTVPLVDDSLLTLEIEPKPIPLMKPLHFRVLSHTSTLPFIEIKLFATNMNMGFHTFKLYLKESGYYEGEGMLPTCVVGNMIWQANVILNASDQSMGATFYFQTDK